MKENKNNVNRKPIYALAIVLALILAYNQVQLFSISARAYALSTGGGSITSRTSFQAADSVIPTGVPEVYGQELGISFDDVSPRDKKKADATIAVLKNIDNTVTLGSSDMDRYIKILSQISCEYCCGAQSVIFNNGKPACGCAHAYAMRGLAKYLIQKHGSGFTDDQILSEVGKWKVLFFPGIHEQKAGVLKAQGIELNYINLTSNKYRGIEKGTTSGGGQMVGGC